VTEINDNLERSGIVQYHALALLVELKRGDKLLLNKLVQQIHRRRNAKAQDPLMTCLWVRIAAHAMYDDHAQGCLCVGGGLTARGRTFGRTWT
jgi:hypothetical protein